MKFNRWERFKYWLFKLQFQIHKVTEYSIIYRFYETGSENHIAQISQNYNLDKPHYSLSFVKPEDQIGTLSSVWNKFIEPNREILNKNCKKMLKNAHNSNSYEIKESGCVLLGKNISNVEWFSACKYEDVTSIENWKKEVWKNEL